MFYLNFMGMLNILINLLKKRFLVQFKVVIPFEDEEDAIKIANSTKYGLVASIWTLDGARQMRVAKAIKSGQVFINNYGAGGGVELPFGGSGLLWPWT